MKRKTDKNASVKTSGAVSEPKKKRLLYKEYVRKTSVTIALIAGVVIVGVVALFAILIVVMNTSNLKTAAVEYDYLRGLAGDIAGDTNEPGGIQLSALDLEMRGINPDYVCWIRVNGTNIDYPVVRGGDNEKYIKTSFYGESNIAGAVFMDYRNIGDPIPHIIIYGHNLQQGGMFTDLRKFLNPRFLEENRIITLIVNGNEVEFEIFSARLSDTDDPAYDLDLSVPRQFARFADKINAPLIATQILTLSTCASGGTDNARVIVQGYRLYN